MNARKNIGPLLAALAVALVPHLTRLPVWVVLWCMVSWGYVLAAVKYNLPQPGKIVRLALTVAGILGVLLSPEGSLDQNSSVALLWIMASIKPMEIRTRRDEMVIIFMRIFSGGRLSVFFRHAGDGSLHDFFDLHLPRPC